MRKRDRKPNEMHWIRTIGVRLLCIFSIQYKLKAFVHGSSRICTVSSYSWNEVIPSATIEVKLVSQKECMRQRRKQQNYIRFYNRYSTCFEKNSFCKQRNRIISRWRQPERTMQAKMRHYKKRRKKQKKRTYKVCVTVTIYVYTRECVPYDFLNNWAPFNNNATVFCALFFPLFIHFAIFQVSLIQFFSISRRYLRFI